MRIASWCLLVVLSACRSLPPADYPITVPESESDPALAPGDKIEIVVYNGGTETMRAPFTLDAAGVVSVQHIGDVVALGKVPSAVRTEVQARLADGYLRDPIVSVNVLEVNSRRVSISGEVQKDGTVKYTPGMTIVDAIAQSGGFTPMAKRNHVRVIRLVAGVETTYTIPVEAIQDGERPNFPLAAGDRVFVPERLW